MQYFLAKNHVFRGPEGPKITKNRRKSLKRRCKNAARKKCVEIWCSGLIFGDFLEKKGGPAEGVVSDFFLILMIFLKFSALSFFT